MSRRKKPEKIATFTWDEVCKRIGKENQMMIMYDGISKIGFVREEKMHKMFSGCELVHVEGNAYKVYSWPKKGD